MKAVVENKAETGYLDKIIEKYKGGPGDVLNILEETQELHKHNYLTRETLEYIAVKLDLPFSKVYSTATFYSFFNLRPQGEHSVVVCRGTACHTKGSKALLDSLEEFLGIKGAFEEGESFFTTADNKFTIRTVACFGQCALAPVVVIDGKIYVHMNARKLSGIIKKFSCGGKKK